MGTPAIGENQRQDKNKKQLCLFDCLKWVKLRVSSGFLMLNKFDCFNI